MSSQLYKTHMGHQEHKSFWSNIFFTKDAHELNPLKLLTYACAPQ